MLQMAPGDGLLRSKESTTDKVSWKSRSSGGKVGKRKTGLYCAESHEDSWTSETGVVAQGQKLKGIARTANFTYQENPGERFEALEIENIDTLEKTNSK